MTVHTHTPLDFRNFIFVLNDEIKHIVRTECIGIAYARMKAWLDDNQEGLVYESVLQSMYEDTCTWYVNYWDKEEECVEWLKRISGSYG